MIAGLVLLVFFGLVTFAILSSHVSMGTRYSPPIVVAHIGYVANYAVEIHRNYPDSWFAGFSDFARLGEISLEGVDGGKDFRAFGTAPDVVRLLVSAPAVRRGLQRFHHIHDALFVDADGVRVRRVVAALPVLGLFADWQSLQAEAQSLADAAYECLRSAPTQAAL